MPYIVLARKYRPQKFDELIGQEHITNLLSEAIETKRLGSAYLFSGPRGVGKTSCARILAKSLNCKKGPTISPCGECPACIEIAESKSFDVIEIDGASNRGIDEIRTLRENVKFAPSYGLFKIYIVDEVHMLTAEAFNALLKTLEEPPEHVKFIFATTAPSKVPATIISRCQRFDFRRIAVETTKKILSTICAKEKIKADDEALFAIAKAASGSLRDALSILDQLGAMKERDIEMSDVNSMLGLVELELIFKLTDCLAQKDCAGALLALDQVVDKGKDIRQLQRDLIEHFRNLMVMKVGGKNLGSLVDYPIATKETLLVQAGNFSLKEILSAIESLIESQETARIMDSLRIPLELTFAKLTFRGEGSVPAASEPVKNNSSPKTPEKPPAKTVLTKTEPSWPSPLNVLSNRKGEVNFSPKPDSDAGTEKEEDFVLGTSEEAPTVSEPLTLARVKDSWNQMTHLISRQKMSVATFLQEGSPYDLKGNRLVISFPPEAVFHKESLEHNDNLKLIEKVFSERLCTDMIIELKVIEGHRPQENEPLIKTVLDTFKGEIVNKWHK